MVVYAETQGLVLLILIVVLVIIVLLVLLICRALPSACHWLRRTGRCPHRA
jgi:competence protein ComGC